MNLAVATTNAGLAVQRQVLSFASANAVLTTFENAAVLYLGAQLCAGQ